MEVRWNGVALPYSVFNKEQRVTHTAIVKAQQDRRLEAKVLTNSEKTGYLKRDRNLYGPFLRASAGMIFPAAYSR